MTKAIGFAVALATTLTPLLNVASAQSTLAVPVCLSGTTVGVGSGKKFSIIAQQSRVGGLEARGFVVEPCSGRENYLQQYRTEICRFAQAAPPAVKTGFTQTHRIGLDEMCQMAEEL